MDGRGSEAPLIMVVADCPSVSEDKSGEAFSGPVWSLLPEMLREAGIDEAAVRMEYLVRCAPSSKVGKAGSRAVEDEECGACVQYLNQMVEKYTPRVIVTMGGAVSGFLFGQKSISRFRGTLVEYAFESDGAGRVERPHVTDDSGQITQLDLEFSNDRVSGTSRWVDIRVVFFRGAHRVRDRPGLRWPGYHGGKSETGGRGPGSVFPGGDDSHPG